MLTISLVAEEVFKLGTLPVTNSLLSTWLAIFILIIVFAIGMARRNLVPQGLQLILESVYGFFLNLCESVLDDKKLAEKAVPFITTIFIFVLASNLTGLLPGVGSIGFLESGFSAPEALAAPGIPSAEPKLIPLFRAPSADLNTTIALALISVIIIQIVGFKTLGLGYLKKFFNFSNPVNFFVGILELISEFAKIISFSFRLFGNVFAGEVLLAVILMLAPYLVPIPFYGLELFVAVIQAFVFAMLTLVFIKLATVSHDNTATSH